MVPLERSLELLAVVVHPVLDVKFNMGGGRWPRGNGGLILWPLTPTAEEQCGAAGSSLGNLPRLRPQQLPGLAEAPRQGSPAVLRGPRRRTQFSSSYTNPGISAHPEASGNQTVLRRHLSTAFSNAASASRRIRRIASFHGLLKRCFRIAPHPPYRVVCRHRGV
ncbi:hypothetical protein evm_003191 [Chilo suppressalis]|nr:hypothetical protein evm_003191 [Chilo suppressalis]